ncbi:uncharacterized protein [Nicotiana sylvestris]|uniref:Uncharacterized protein LOC104220835 n=1 Tax=Nicotiana sylvestris TaxID=4096 RepID=A0A1U7VUQ9_NICSY|nr:PREDICTED: uncharacterized protein LOC104220835 [Nicotiana sylvestris]
MIMSANSSSSYKLRSLVTLLHHYYRVRINGESSQLQGIVPATRIGYGGSISPGLRFISSGDYRIPKTTDQVKNEANIVPPEEPAPSKPSLFAWTKWILGSIISIFLPFWKDKWDNFRRIEGEVEKVVEEVEEVAEVVAAVATKTENVMAGIAEKLPENSLLKEAAVAVENASAVAAKEAQFTSNLIHKVEYVERDLKDLKTMVEPVIEKIEELESSKK